MMREIGYGLIAGAAGTTALNGVTYLDMALRGRPGSSTPEQTVERMEELADTPLPGSDSESVDNRRSGFGALLGIGAGLGTGAVYGVLRSCVATVPRPLLALGTGLGANVASTGPMAALGVTEPRTWPAQSWVMDLVPHLAYGFATVATFHALTRGQGSGS